jgi:integrase
MRDATARVGLKGVTFHDLRHVAASALIAAGCSVKAVQAFLGHATAAETLHTYGHLWPSDGDAIRAAIARLLTPPESRLSHEGVAGQV